MSINKKESCYGCIRGCWVTDHHGTSYCCYIKGYNVGERHIQGKINIEECWKTEPEPIKWRVYFNHEG